MADTVKIAIAALQERANELLEDRFLARQQILSASARDVAIERDLNGCIAGARALGQELDIPKPQTLSAPAQTAFSNFLSYRQQIAQGYQHLKALFEVQDGDEVEEIADEDAAQQPEMPRVADIILERLKVAGEEGTKAIDIRRYIHRTYKADIHEKTVGMTLYRLAKDGKVHRDGHTWFLAS